MALTLPSIITEYVLEAQARTPSINTVHIPYQIYRAAVRELEQHHRIGVQTLEWVTNHGSVRLLPEWE